jgi:hypothetical protein
VLKKTFKISLFFIVCIFFIQFGCETKSSSEGDFDKIIVFSDSILYHEVRSGLDNVFDHYVHTPHAERSFYHQWSPINLLDSYKERRNLILIGLLEKDDPVSDYVKKMLSPEVQEKIQNGEIFEIFRENLFARDQMVIILCALNKNQLLENLSNRAESIFSRFEEYHFKRLSEILFSNDEQINIEEYLAKEYGWSIRVPYAFQVAHRSPDSNFVWIKRTDPSRSIFVFKTKYDETKINEGWIIHVRDSLALVYFDADSVLKEDTYTIRTEFNGRPALQVVGIWQNHQQYVGGPFRSYVFYDKDSDFTYFIDISVVAPGKRKKPYLDQLEVMARTFRLIPN